MMKGCVQMKTRSFEDWFATFRSSIDTYEDFRIDFEKVQVDIQNLKIEVYILNSLINSKNIEAEFENILAEYPKCKKAVQLIAQIYGYNFDTPNQSIAQYKYFMRETGLFELLEKHLISNLYDYLTGVEVGLDSNGRKNRGGRQMENLVEKFLKQAGVEYSAETYLPEIFPNKRWDFVVRTAENIFALETNFYTDGGSKINETARSYRLIAEQAENISGFKFVWITDGKGWHSARQNLRETFLVLRDLYNIKDLEEGKFLELFK